jgi:hypothetical protein
LAEQNDISYVLRQRSAGEFCEKQRKSSAKTLGMLQNAYGTEAMSLATVSMMEAF